jgi:hypothetical protein
VSLRPRSARSWTRSIEAPARYSSHVARRADRLGVLKASQIFGERLGLEHCRIAQTVAQKELGLSADQPLRQAARLDQEEPVIARRRGLLVDRLKAVEGRNDVEQCQSLDALGVIARQAVGDPGATDVPSDSKALEAERSHRLDLVLR